MLFALIVKIVPRQERTGAGCVDRQAEHKGCGRLGGKVPSKLQMMSCWGKRDRAGNLGSRELQKDGEQSGTFKCIDRCIIEWNLSI